MLLDDIIDLATDNKQSITILLRKCVIFASQLKNERLKVWANSELNGYPRSEKELPEYRVLSAGAIGNYIGPGYAQTQRIIPSAMLKKEHRGWAETVYLSQSIKTLEHSIESGSDTLTFPWDHNLVLLYQETLLSGWMLASAGQVVPKSVIAGLLDTVRTRVLNMALEIKSEIGETDADLKKITPQDSKKVDQTIVNKIYGGNVYVSTGESTMNAATIQHQQKNIVAGDWEQLAKVLRNSGVSEPELDELSTAVKEDGRTMGAKVKGWIAKTAPKVLSGGVKIGVSVGQTLLLEYLKQYYGLS